MPPAFFLPLLAVCFFHHHITSTLTASGGRTGPRPPTRISTTNQCDDDENALLLLLLLLFFAASGWVCFGVLFLFSCVLLAWAPHITCHNRANARVKSSCVCFFFAGSLIRKKEPTNKKTIAHSAAVPRPPISVPFWLHSLCGRTECALYIHLFSLSAAFRNLFIFFLPVIFRIVEAEKQMFSRRRRRFSAALPNVCL